VERPRRVVLRTIDASARPGSWRTCAGAAFGGDLSLTWLPLRVMPDEHG
jgi:hypothetical protein